MKTSLLSASLTNMDMSVIDLSPGPFCMSYGFDLKPLKDSINSVGLINPPYLIKGKNYYHVVAGYRRLLAARELGFTKLNSYVLPDGFPYFKALLVNLHDNLLNREFNDIEKGMVLVRLSAFLKKSDTLSLYMPALGLSPDLETYELYLELQKLEDPVKHSVSSGRVCLRTAEYMIKSSQEDRLILNNLFNKLKFSFNQQCKLVQWIEEIAGREGRPVREIIEDETGDILKNNKLNNPQKIKSMVNTLRKKRFPSLLKAESLFRKGISKLKLPPGAHVIPPGYFEGNEYKLEIQFSKGEELREKINGILNSSGLEKVHLFWKGTDPDEGIKDKKNPNRKGE